MTIFMSKIQKITPKTLLGNHGQATRAGLISLMWMLRNTGEIRSRLGSKTPHLFTTSGMIWMSRQFLELSQELYLLILCTIKWQMRIVLTADIMLSTEISIISTERCNRGHHTKGSCKEIISSWGLLFCLVPSSWVVKNMEPIGLEII